MIKFLKQYEGKSFEELVNSLIWFDLPNRLKAIFAKLPSGDSRPYKVYTALLTQTGTNAPAATVLENTIGDIVWSRDDAGNYYGTLVGAFTPDKTTFTASSYDAGRVVGGFSDTEDTVYLFQEKAPYTGTNYADSFTNISIEIRVYS